MSPTNPIDPALHRQMAVKLFNETWGLLDQPMRTASEDDDMIHMAHASRYHWGVVGQPVNLARGEWQIARVYTVLNRAEPALHHATRSLQYCEDYDLGSFEVGFAHEAMARAYALHGLSAERDAHWVKAMAAAAQVEDGADRRWLTRNIEGVKSDSIPEWE